MGMMCDVMVNCFSSDIIGVFIEYVMYSNINDVALVN